jgi:putative ABC transport system permease protein
LAAQGQTLDIANVDDEVFVPLATAMHRLKNIDYYSGIAFEISDWNRMAAGADQIHTVLKRRHSALRNQPDDFQVQTQKQLFETQMTASSRLTALVNWIATSALFVSGIGVLAISWLAVKNRTAEMGTRRALGATAADLFFQILFETVCVSVLGSAAGVALGWLAGRALLERAGLPLVFDGGNALFAVGLASLLNLTFALLPAEKAARLDLIVALRHE